MKFFVDIDVAMKESPWIRADFDIDFHQIRELYCPAGSAYISAAAPEIERILKKLWSLFDASDPLAITQMKVYTLALFSMLSHQKEIAASQSGTFFTETQVDIAKRVESIITSDLRQHHPVWELASQFSVSETTLKNYFRGVYGQNISVYLREVRVKKAAELLSSKVSVAEVAEQVGYMNQSKFASVFKKQFDLSTLEYRRAKSLEKS